MRKYHVHTTISLKHQELLKKQVEQYETQQRVIELALESLENNSQPSPGLSPEEQLLLRCYRDKLVCVAEKEVVTWLLEYADIEQFELLKSLKKSMAYALEYYYQRPLKQLSLKEIMYGMAVWANVSNTFKMYDYSEDSDYYMLKIIHNMGLNGSKYYRTVVENVFDAYGVKYETTMSENTIFIKIYKKSEQS